MTSSVQHTAVAFYPNSPQWSANPYLQLLGAALEAQGVALVDPHNDFVSSRWLWTARKRVDVLHLHWIQYHYLTSSRRGSWVRLASYVRKMIWAKVLGYRIVWTMHNVLPHETLPGRIDWVARWLTAHLADAVLVLCEAGRAELALRFGRRRSVHTTPIGVYSLTPSSSKERQESRSRLGFPQRAVVYLYFGGIRPHKNVVELIQSFAGLVGNDLLLIVVGAVHDADLGGQVQVGAAHDPRVRLVLRHVSDELLQAYLAAADIVVTPFAQVMSSSSVIAAMSAARPVIAPRLGCLPEWVSPGCGILYDAEQEGSLTRAMQAAQVADLETMGQTAYRRALSFTWEDVAKSTLAAYAGPR